MDMLVLFLGLVGSVVGRTRCVDASGKLVCRQNPDRATFVKIKMMDEDPLPWEQDDTMGVAFSEENGSFNVAGCGYDFAPWNSPDPYLTMEHQCHNFSDTVWLRYWTWFDDEWVPRESEVGEIYLDDSGDVV